MDSKSGQNFGEMKKNVLASAGQACEWVLETGHARAGQNGPFAKPETPVRNTASWLMGFSYAYQSSGEERFLSAANMCADYLMGGESRPGGAAFSCFQAGGEKWNGLISQAWVLDALCEMSKVTGDKRYAEVAREVFNLHAFDYARGLWKKLGIHGDVLGIDQITHHQLWFAAVGAVLAHATGDEEIQARVERFLEVLDKNLLIYRKGLIMQRMIPLKKERLVSSGIVVLKRAVVNPILGRGLRYKEKGYQAYNLYAFAMLKKEGFGDMYFRSLRFKRMLEYAFSNEILNALEKANHAKDSTGLPLGIDMPVNRYGYPYNAPGFTMPYIYDAFRDLLPSQAVDAVKRAVDKQQALTYSEEERRFSKNTEDAETLTARAYLFARGKTLLESEVEG